jgi:hypothetical protein
MLALKDMFSKIRIKIYGERRIRTVAPRTLRATESDLRQQVVDQLVETRRHDSARPLASTSTKKKKEQP